MDQNQLNEINQSLTKYKAARSNLLLIVIFSVVNIILLLAHADLYFLFTAELPYRLVVYGMLFTNRIPGVDLMMGTPLPDAIFYGFLAVALIVIVFYLCCWIFSKEKKKIWFILALVGFSIDTLICLGSLIEGFDFSSLLNLAFHVWAIISISSGLKAGKTLEKYKDIDFNQLQAPTNAPVSNGFPTYDNSAEYSNNAYVPGASNTMTDTQQNYWKVMADYEAQKAAEAAQAAQNNEFVQINSDNNNPNV